MNMKALREKFAAITEEQGKELAAAVEAKDMAALETFCQKHGIELAADEKEAVAEYFKTGKLPLADQELENVAGGGCFDPPHPHSLQEYCPACECPHVRWMGTAAMFECRFVLCKLKWNNNVRQNYPFSERLYNKYRQINGLGGIESWLN
jgi:hypothetical protein